MVRFYVKKEESVNKEESVSKVGVFLIDAGEITFHDLGNIDLNALLEEIENHEGAYVPTEAYAIKLRKLFFPSEIWEAITAGSRSHVVIVPQGELFNLPLHIAKIEEGSAPLCAQVPLCFSVSAVMHFATERHQLRSLKVNPGDTLTLIANIDNKVSGESIVGTSWDDNLTRVFGDMPENKGLSDAVEVMPCDWDSLSPLNFVPHFLCIACHGTYDPAFDQLYGPTLKLGGGDMEFVSQFDIATKLNFTGNQFLSINACVSGHGGMEGGNVSGFLRAFIATGAGALGVTQFSVHDRDIVKTVKNLLRGSRKVAENGGTEFDLVGKLQQYYASRPTTVMDMFPLVIYL